MTSTTKESKAELPLLTRTGKLVLTVDNSNETPEQKSKREKECKRCEDWKDEIIQKNTMVKTLLGAMKRAGCNFEKKHFRCVPCDNSGSGGFSAEEGIILCQNHFISRPHMEETVVHELIHAFDYCKYNLDLTNCKHHACTEVRAASLSGDCKLMREFLRGKFRVKKQHQECVRRRAILSVKYNPSCKDEEQARNAVNSVFESCYADTTPFGDHDRK
ncbi:Mitochondrial inner membrane protease atp23 [Basidiobolus ranarum]|uniref:Mitochondrial inner membrane protease ATP23 n=1 Tax=Basidiobolus ranarum TaxID=34480 RepID=A0ABR2WW74_9FUNG